MFMRKEEVVLLGHQALLDVGHEGGAVGRLQARRGGGAGGAGAAVEEEQLHVPLVVGVGQRRKGRYGTAAIVVMLLVVVMAMVIDRALTISTPAVHFCWL